MSVYRCEYKVVMEITTGAPETARGIASDSVVACMQAVPVDDATVMSIEHLSTTDLYPPAVVDMGDLIDD